MQTSSHQFRVHSRANSRTRRDWRLGRERPVRPFARNGVDALMSRSLEPTRRSTRASGMHASTPLHYHVSGCGDAKRQQLRRRTPTVCAAMPAPTPALAPSRADRRTTPLRVRRPHRERIRTPRIPGGTSNERVRRSRAGTRPERVTPYRARTPLGSAMKSILECGWRRWRGTARIARAGRNDQSSSVALPCRSTTR